MDEHVMLGRSKALVVAMVGGELALKWWESANRAFEGKTPQEMWDENPSRVYTYLMSSHDGEW